jgi:hypothetical protein
MRIVQSALIPIGNEELKIIPVKGQVGLYSIENAYSGNYQFFRAPLVETSTSKKGEPTPNIGFVDLK